MKCGKSKFSNHALGGSLRLGLPSNWLLAPLIATLLTLGMTPVWSQASDQKSSGSNETSPDFELSLETLNSLRNQASNQLNELTRSLNQAFQEAQTSRQQLTSLRNSLDNALRRSIDLENTNQRIAEFNQQIGERMRERDADLANAYDELEDQDKKILKLWIAVAALGLVCLVLIAFDIVKLLVKLHIL
jgi:cell division protein ZapA (FtsZ GTPase activity inhibitor)